MYIEVKTMRNKSCSINITRKEYWFAHKKDSSPYHWFYILVWNPEQLNNVPELYVFKDLFSISGLKDKYQEIFREEHPKKGSNTRWNHKNFSLKLDKRVFGQRDYYYVLNDQSI